jgi:hypothetical protein
LEKGCGGRNISDISIDGLTLEFRIAMNNENAFVQLQCKYVPGVMLTDANHDQIES